MIQSAILALVVAAALVSASPVGPSNDKEAKFSNDVSEALIPFEVFSNGVSKVNLALISDALTNELIEQAIELLGDKDFAPEIAKHPRVHAFADALDKTSALNPSTTEEMLEAILSEYQEGRQKYLGDVNNYQLMKDTPTGKLIQALACSDASNLSKQQVDDALRELGEYTANDPSSLAQVEKHAEFLDHLPMRLLLETNLWQLHDTEARKEMSVEFQSELQEYGFNIQC